MCQDDLYEFEAATRYDSDYTADEDDYQMVRSALKNFLDLLTKRYVPDIANQIRGKVKAKELISKLSDIDLVKQYYNVL